MPVASLLRIGLAAGVGLLLLISPAEACGPTAATKGVWEKHVVFVGLTLETGLVPPSSRATRYRVEASNQLRSGEEVIVFTTTGSCGGGTHPVGTRGVVVASAGGTELTTSSTLRMAREESGAILKALGLPPDFWTEPQTPPSESLLQCSHPKTLADAVRSADAVISSFDERSCYNETLGKVESVVAAQSSYKGPKIDEWFIIVHAPNYRRQLHPKAQEFVKTFGYYWPPAEFLKEIPNLTESTTKTYLNDGCLTPNFPTGSQEKIKWELAKYFPGPNFQKSSGRLKTPLPELSCNTFDASLLWKAREHLKALKARMHYQKIPPLEKQPNILEPDILESDSNAPSQAASPDQQRAGFGEAAHDHPSSRVVSADHQGTHPGGAPSASPNAPARTKAGCASCSVGAQRSALPSWAAGLLSLLLFGLQFARRKYTSSQSCSR